MGNFVFDLWDSIFTPGTTPALIYATHGSFTCLVLTLTGLLVATRNPHFVALLTLSLCLWAAITWFIAEVEKEKKRQGVEKLGDKSSAAQQQSGEITTTADVKTSSVKSPASGGRSRSKKT